MSGERPRSPPPPLPGRLTPPLPLSGEGPIKPTVPENKLCVSGGCGERGHTAASLTGSEGLPRSHRGPSGPQATSFSPLLVWLQSRLPQSEHGAAFPAAPHPPTTARELGRWSRSRGRWAGWPRGGGEGAGPGVSGQEESPCLGWGVECGVDRPVLHQTQGQEPGKKGASGGRGRLGTEQGASAHQALLRCTPAM